MDGKYKKLGDAELEIMLALWQAQEPVTSNWILQHLRERRGWPLSTLMTTLSRLADKGFVACDRSTRTNYYTALVSEQAYKASEDRGLLRRLHGGSVGDLVACLYDDSALTADDVDALRALVERMQHEQEPRG